LNDEDVMNPTPQVVSAASISLDAFADLFTRSFAGYFYPNTPTAAIMARRVRTEQLDLAHSLVLLADGEPAGLAVLALRDDRAWCGGFGVVQAFRGRGLAHHLAEAMIREARTSGARSLQLEVLTRNTAAIATYQRAGLHTERDLLIMGWKAADHDPVEAADVPLETVPPHQVLDPYALHHPVRAAWQRELPTLLARTDLQARRLTGAIGEAAVVIAPTQEGSAQIVDLVASRVEAANAILRALQRQYRSLVCVNEPENSPWLAVFRAAGFVESDRQHEMHLPLEQNTAA
jgi:RimJ/RimL family protein N-acetyltransferase